VYKNPLATFKCQIQLAEDPTPAAVISTEAAHVDNANLLYYLTSEVALEEPQIGSTDPNNPINNNYMDDEQHFGIRGGCEECDEVGNEIGGTDTIPTASW